LNSAEIGTLATLVGEAIRSTDSGVRRFVEPAPGTLQQATSKTHSIVFGRRGSGKSSLLRKAAADLTIDRRPIAYVDLETFKGHSYPDVLLSVLIKTFREFASWLDTAAVYPANRTSFWKKLFASPPSRPSFNRKEATRLSQDLKKQIQELEALLFSSDETEIQRFTKQATDKSAQKEVAVGSSQYVELEARVGGSESFSRSEEIHETFQSKKIDFLHRHILDYQQLFRDMTKLSDGDSFLFLDDLYHIRRADQARVIDYFHRVAKNNGLWLKIGTIRHRTDWYVHGDPAYGMKLGDDAQEINLDLTLEEYNSTKEFLVKILEGFVRESGDIQLASILNDNAIERLVLASGGVARDFLGVFRKAIAAARNRKDTSKRPRIGLEDINSASGDYASTKQEEFKKDTADDVEHTTLEESFRRVREFCIQAQTSLFLVEPIEESPGYAVIQELVDLRLIHKAVSRVSISKRPGKRFEAYMLDVSQYTQYRKRKGFKEMTFWGTRPRDRDNIRRLDLILETTSLVGKHIPIESIKGHQKANVGLISNESNTGTKTKQAEQLEMF
jgi:hypothetical protein